MQSQVSLKKVFVSYLLTAYNLVDAVYLLLKNLFQLLSLSHVTKIRRLNFQNQSSHAVKGCLV